MPHFDNQRCLPWCCQDPKTGHKLPKLKAELLRLASLRDTLRPGADASQTGPGLSPAQGSDRGHKGIISPASSAAGKGGTDETAPSPGLPQPDRGPPVGAPLRPRHYVCRDLLSSAAVAPLLRGSGERGGGGGVVVAFAGSPGAGKSCLAAEVVRRRDVRAKFADGVLWLQVLHCGRTGCGRQCW